MTTPENPWATEAGRRAREVQLRLLSKKDGVIGEFAADVVAGRAEPRALLYSSILPEKDLETLRTTAEKWNRLPEDEKRTLADDWADITRRTIDELNSLPEPPAEPAPAPPRRRPVVEEEEDEPPQDWFDGKLRGH